MKKSNEDKSTKRLTFISLKEIGEEINLRNEKSIRNWVISRGLTIHKVSSKSFIYRIEYELNIDKPLVIELRKKNPHNWKLMYKAIAKSEELYELMLIVIEQETNHIPTSFVTTKSKSDEKLLKYLAA